MDTPATVLKRQELLTFIERELVDAPQVQAVIGIGSLAEGTARNDSDIDAIIFLEPFDLYVVPADCRWQLSDGSFHSFLSQDPGGDSLYLDFARLDLSRWRSPDFEWPEARKAELAKGWLAFDRTGEVAHLIAGRTTYPEETRLAKLDEALIWLDHHLEGDSPHRRWERLGPVVVHDRLNATYEWLAQALFAYNRRWRPWRNREMSALLRLPWLPSDFEGRVMAAFTASSADFSGYLSRLEALRSLYASLSARLQSEPAYGDQPVTRAYQRGTDEPGRPWNMEEWNRKRLRLP